MSATIPPRDTAEAVAPTELGHPVRSFTLVVLAVAVLLLVLRWTGAVHPNLESPGGSHTSLGQLQLVLVEVHNASALPVRLEGATWPADGALVAELGLAPDGWNEDGSLDLAHIPPLLPVTIDANTSRWLVLSVVPSCLAHLGEPTVRVRTALGLHRTVDLPGQQAQDLSGAC